MDSKKSLAWDPPIVAKCSAPKQPTVTGDTICSGEAQILHPKPKDAIGETSVPETPAIIAERNGEVEFRVIYDDADKESMEILDNLRSIYKCQYPEMPKDLIDRHVNDPEYRSIAIVRMPQETTGGITFRQLGTWNFPEVAFCAVSSEEQAKGYGAALLDHLKDYIKAASPIIHLITYSDNYYIGLSVKQGFTRATLNEGVCRECRKGYGNVTLMQCSVKGGIAGRQYKP